MICNFINKSDYEEFKKNSDWLSGGNIEFCFQSLAYISHKLNQGRSRNPLENYTIISSGDRPFQGPRGRQTTTLGQLLFPWRSSNALYFLACRNVLFFLSSSSPEKLTWLIYSSRVLRKIKTDKGFPSLWYRFRSLHTSLKLYCSRIYRLGDINGYCLRCKQMGLALAICCFLCPWAEGFLVTTLHWLIQCVNVPYIELCPLHTVSFASNVDDWISLIYPIILPGADQTYSRCE